MCPTPEEYAAHRKEYERERRQNKLPTESDRVLFVEQVASSMELAARALQDAAKKLRENSDVMLGMPFEPNIQGGHPSMRANLELMILDGKGKPCVEIRSRTRLDQKRFREVATRHVWCDGLITAEDDNRVG